MLYALGRRLFKLAVRQFFSEIKLKGAAPTENGPLLVVPNHANFLIDSLVITSLFRREFYFMAKSTLFKGGLINAVLRACHLIPLYRRADNDDTSKNEQSFKFAVEALEQHKAITLFPEGVSMGERKLYPLKTGAARIALLAEEHSGWTLGLKIQPVGLNYSDIDQFRSSITVYFDTPLVVSEWRDRYARDAIEAVRALTDTITSRLKALTVEVQDQRHNQLVEKIAKLYQSLGSGMDDHQRLQLITRNLEVLAPKYPEKTEELEGRIGEYLGMLQSLGFSDNAALESNISRAWLLLALPLSLIGFALHYLPYRLVGPWARRLSTHPVSLGSLKLLVGIGLFTLWYLGILFILLLCGFGIFSSIITVAFVVFSGHFLNQHADTIRLQVISGLWPGEHNPLNVLRIVRAELIEELEALRVE